VFNLNTQQYAKLNKWKQVQTEKAMKLQEVSGSSELNAGAIGGVYTYSFTPTSLGTVVKITNGLTNDVLDLSDYEDW